MSHDSIQTHSRVCQLSTNYGQNITYVRALSRGGVEGEHSTFRSQMVGLSASIGGTVAVIINVRR